MLSICDREPVAYFLWRFSPIGYQGEIKCILYRQNYQQKST